jgi:hypothetical protein
MDAQSTIESALRAARQHRASARAETEARIAAAAAARAAREKADAEARRGAKKVRIEIIVSVGGPGFSFEAGDIVEVDAALAQQFIKAHYAQRSVAPLRLINDERAFQFQTPQSRLRDRLQHRQSFALPSDSPP